MPYNGSGVFNRLYSWVTDNNNGLDIRADRMDEDSDDIADGLSDCLTKDGQQTPTANLKMGGFRLTNLGTGVASTDSVTLGQAQAGSTIYAVATGPGNAISIAMTPTTSSLTDGQTYRFRAVAANSGPTTLQVDANSAYGIVTPAGNACVGGEIIVGGMYECIYSSSGTKFTLLNPSNGYKWVTAGGTAQAITASYTPANTALYDGLELGLRFAAANTAAAPSFAPDGLTAYAITKLGGIALVPGDIAGSLHEGLLRYNLANTRWELLNPAIPQGTAPWVVASGTSDGITATYTPVIPALYDGLLCFFRAIAANTTTAPTFSPNGLAVANITKKGGLPLGVGDIPGALAEVILRYSLANSRWELLNPSTSPPSPAYRNKFRNPSMDIWSRGIASITVSASGAYVADGWIVAPAGASCTAQKTTANQRIGAVSAQSLLLSGASSVTDMQIKQRIESVIAQQLEGQVVTFQAQIYNNTGSGITPTLTVKHAGSSDVWTSPTTDVNGVSLQACPSGVWTQISYTFTSSTSSGNGLEITVDFGNNFSTAGKSVQITELDLSPSGTVLIPELRPLPIELVFNQRYFCSSYPLGIAPGTSGNNLSIANSNASGGSIGQAIFPVQMRVIPSINYWDGAGNASTGSYYTNALTRTDSTSLNQAPTDITTRGFLWDSATGTTGQCGAIGWQATAEL